MHDMNLEKYRSKIQTAYKASPFTKGTCPEPEDAVKRFESRYTPIPAEYRWLLLNFGGCYLAEPWIFTLKELEEAYPTFQDAFVDYMSIPADRRQTATWPHSHWKLRPCGRGTQTIVDGKWSPV